MTVVGVVTDSSACVPADLAARLGIVAVPIVVHDASGCADVEATDRDVLLARLRSGERFTTAAPSPGAYLDAVDAQEQGAGVVVVTLSGSMSSAHRAATLAASQAHGRVEVVETPTAAGGVGLVAIAAAHSATDGASIDKVREVAEHVASRVRLLAAVGSLQYLARSGRVPELARRAGDALGIRPLFEFREGQPRVLRPSLSETTVRNRLVAAVAADRPSPQARLHATALHGERPDDARDVLAAVATLGDTATAFVSRFDPGMLVHTGPDLIGVAWWWERR